MKILTIIFLIFFSFSSFALSPEKRLENEQQEERAQKLFLEIKCPVCGGQAIESSTSEFAFEVRKLVREKISQGQSDEEIKQYLIKQFGPNIIGSNRIDKQNYLLWLLPFAFAIFGLIFFLKILRDNFRK